MISLERKSVTPDEAAAILGISRKHVYQYIREGVFTAFDITIRKRGGPRSIRILRQDIVEFISSRRIDPNKIDSNIFM